MGGFVKKYRIDVDPDAIGAYGIKLQEVFKSVKTSNVGARSAYIFCDPYNSLF